MSQPAQPGEVAAAPDTVRAADIEPTRSTSSLSPPSEKDAQSSEHVAAATILPHLPANVHDQDGILDAQAGAVGATWKHRVPALLMIIFFTRMLSLVPLAIPLTMSVSVSDPLARLRRSLLASKSEAILLSRPSRRSSRPSRRKSPGSTTPVTARSLQPNSWSTAYFRSSRAS